MLLTMPYTGLYIEVDGDAKTRFFFFSSRRRHTIFKCDWSSDVCSSDLVGAHPTLVVNDDVGTIHINAGGNSVTVQATEHNNGFWGNPNDAQVNYSQNGDTVTVNACVKANLGFFSTDSVDLNITVPSTADFQLKPHPALIYLISVHCPTPLS